MLTALVGVAQKIRDGSLDWWILGTLLVLSVMLLLGTGSREGVGDQPRRGIKWYWLVLGAVVPVWATRWLPAYGMKHSAPVTACDMRIGRSEYLKLSGDLRQIRSHHPSQEVTSIVEPGRVDSCLYAHDLREVFRNATWNAPAIKDRGEGLIERDVYFYHPPNDADAEGFCKALSAYKDPAIHCEPPPKNSPNNAWEFYIKD